MSSLSRESVFDRQLRLWGDRGQDALENSKVVLLNGCATGSELLKNLVLSGVGNFTIIDGAPVEERDIANDFFLLQENLGQRRGECLVNSINKLNPSSKGFFIDMSPGQLIADSIQILESFDLVLVANVDSSSTSAIAEYCERCDIPVFSLTTNGLFGFLDYACGPHPVKSRSSEPVEDLRLTAPFPALLAYCATVNLDALEPAEHERVPYVVLLILLLQRWRAMHEGQSFPTTSEEKEEFRALIRSEMAYPDEENTQQALQFAFKACLPYKIPAEVMDVISHPKVIMGPKSPVFEPDPNPGSVGGSRIQTPIHSQRSQPSDETFWLLAGALKLFVEKTGTLPHSGQIPDMLGSSSHYTALASLYRQKAEDDLSLFQQCLGTVLANMGYASDHLPPPVVSSFCRLATTLALHPPHSLLTPRSLRSDTALSQRMQEGLEAPDSLLKWLVVKLAIDELFVKTKAFPGE